MGEIDDLIESARLLGSVQAKRGFGCYTAEDSRFEHAMHESIAKHRRALTRPAPSEAEVVGEPWRVTVTEGGWTGTYEEWKRWHGIKPAAPSEAEVEAAAKRMWDAIGPRYLPFERNLASTQARYLRMARAALGVE